MEKVNILGLFLEVYTIIILSIASVLFIVRGHFLYAICALIYLVVHVHPPAITGGTLASFTSRNYDAMRLATGVLLATDALLYLWWTML